MANMCREIQGFAQFMIDIKLTLHENACAEIMLRCCFCKNNVLRYKLQDGIIGSVQTLD